MPLKVNIGGTFKNVPSIKVNIGGSWKVVKGIETNIGGTWKNAAGLVTLSGETGISDAGSGPRHAGLRFNTDGTLDKLIGTSTFTQIDAATDWIIPNDQQEAIYEVRYVSFVGDEVFLLDPSGENTWVALSESRTWRITNTTGSTTETASCDFEIRLGSSGSAIATASYAFSAEVF